MVHQSRSISCRSDYKTAIKTFTHCDCEETLHKRVPITKWLPHYNLTTLFHDLLAGFTVSLTEIPQGIAYADITGTPPINGLYSCIMGGFAYAIFGSCKNVNIGPTSIVSMMVQPWVTKFGPDVAVLLSFISGVIILTFGILNLGFLINFFSYPVVAGFTCAASLDVASIQLNNFFGIPGRARGFLDAWIKFFTNFNEIRLWDTLLGVTSLLTLLTLQEIKRFGSLRYRKDWSRTRNIIAIITFFLSLSRNALVIVIGMILAYFLRGDAPFRITGDINGGLPTFESPPFSTKVNGTTYSFSEIASELGFSMLLIPLVAILETISVAKTFTRGTSLDPTQEILSLGVSNLLSSFIGSMPVSGAFSRSAINDTSEVRTPFGGIFTSIVVLLAIAFLTPDFYYVPKATVAAVIVCAMGNLFEYRAFVTFWKNKKLDLIPFLSTFVFCLFISLEYGILIGIGVNLAFILYPSARPKVIVFKQVVLNHSGEVYIVKPLDNLHFPSAERLIDLVLECKGANIVVIIDGEYLRTVDTTVARSMVLLSRELTKRESRIIFWNFKPSISCICIGLDKSLQDCFQTGELEDIVGGTSVKIVSQF